MRIIVNNEEEKKLIKKFIEVIRDFGFDAIEEWEKDILEHEPGLEPTFWFHERQAIDDGLSYARIIVDESVPEIMYEDDELVTGTCCKCGDHTSGTEDGETTYKDYLKYMSEESQKKWLCSDCYNKGLAEEFE